MKRNYFYLLMIAFTLLVATSCNSCKTQEQTKANPQIEWNVTASAQGNGEVRIGFPTGTISLLGDAQLRINSAKETEKLRGVKMYEADSIINNADDFTSDQVEAANEVKSVFYVDTLKGSWNVDVEGYAKYGQIYIVIDEHFPKDTAR